MTSLDQPETLIRALEAVIRERRGASPDTSYVARLAAKGRAAMAQKLGEEAVETVVAAMADDAEAAVSESADLVFHLLVLLADMDLSFDAVIDRLADRQGLSGLVEKAARGRD